MRNRRSTAIAVSLVLLATALVYLRDRGGRGTDPGATKIAGSSPDGAGAGGSSSANGGRTLPPGSTGAEAGVARGVVREQETDSPIAGARILILDGSSNVRGEPVGEALADAQGVFEVPCRGGGPVVAAKAHGFWGVERKLTCAKENVLYLRKGVTVEGRVIARTTQDGVPGARVRCTFNGNELRTIDETESGEEGRFVLGGCRPADAVRVVATREGMSPAWADLGARKPGESVRGVVLELEKGRLLAGRVVDAAGDPVPDAEVVLLEGGSWERSRALTSSETGRFDAAIGNGEHVVGAFAPDGRAARTVVPAGEVDPAPVELRLPAWGTMKGRLVGPHEGASVTAVRIGEDPPKTDPTLREYFWIHAGRGSFRRTAQVDGDRFTFLHVEPGRYSLRAHTESGQGSAEADHDDEDIVIRIQDDASIVLRATWSDGTPADGTVEFFHENGAGFFASPDTVTGKLRIPPGPIMFRLHPPAGPISGPAQFEAGSGKNEFEWRISKDNVVVEGRVFDATSGAPVSGARVSMASAHPFIEVFPWEQTEPFVETDTDGRFRLTLASMQEHVFVSKTGYASKVVPANAVSEIRLAPGQSIPSVDRTPHAGTRPAGGKPKPGGKSLSRR